MVRHADVEMIVQEERSLYSQTPRNEAWHIGMDQRWSVGRGEEREDHGVEYIALQFLQEGKAGPSTHFRIG